MLIMASLEKMKGQVFQKHPCVCPEHEKYSPGENGFSVSTSKYLGAPNTWGTVHAHVTHEKGKQTASL